MKRLDLVNLPDGRQVFHEGRGQATVFDPRQWEHLLPKPKPVLDQFGRRRETKVDPPDIRPRLVVADGVFRLDDPYEREQLAPAPILDHLGRVCRE